MLSTILLASLALQDTPATTRDRFATELDSRFVSLDADGNGALDVAEMEVAASRRAEAMREAIARNQRQRFDALDKDGNGSLDFEEFKALMRTPRVTPDSETAVERFDSDGDGTVSQAEFRNGQLAIFDRLDTDGDGRLSEEERRNAGAPAARAPTGNGRVGR
ncbi:EF-hand domain-containing protein [Sphingomicrobium aestuariivivum]|uniref:EF-hand domain-containing protein n=1 Tax=Sphingomicrobium aestuariivivum TaxID=1582356 RepID=UPI001FD65094|nr:EF-hand domain-containing protein [Sphingomicrobium aestuariivivum]MCJ8191061.1 EF-hand domain-containing protein [Sphingomicrobium aestuariivivum]